MNTKKMAKRLKDSGVSPVIATILMVAITVVLAAVLYVMVSGFTHSPGTANSAGMTSSQNATGKYTITINSVSNSNIKISTLKIVISGSTDSDGTYSALFATPNAAYTAPTTSSSTVEFFYTISGNSGTYLNVGDFIVLGTVSSNHLSGATVTLYSGGASLGSVVL